MLSILEVESELVQWRARWRDKADKVLCKYYIVENGVKKKNIVEYGFKLDVESNLGSYQERMA